MEKIFPASGTKLRGFDLRLGNPGIQLLFEIRCSEVEMRLRPFLASLNSSRIRDHMDDFLSHFVTAPADVRADRCAQRFRLDMKFFDEP